MRSLMLSLCAAAAGLQAHAGVTFWNQEPHTPDAPEGNGLATYTFGDVSVETADDFRIGVGGMRLESISVVGTFSVFGVNGAPDNIILRIYNKSGIGPGTQVGGDMAFSAAEIQADNLGTFYFGREAMRLTVDIADIDLAEGDYFLSLQVIDDNMWFWTTSTPDTPIALNQAVSRSLTGDPFFNIGTDWTASEVFSNNGAHDLAFSLVGSRIPAPGALAMLGLAGLAARRRR